MPLGVYFWHGSSDLGPREYILGSGSQFLATRSNFRQSEVDFVSLRVDFGTL